MPWSSLTKRTASRWAQHGTALEQVKPDSKWRTKNLPKLQAFWQEYVEERDDPDRAKKHLEPKRVIVDTPEAVRLIEEYDDLTEAIDRATQRRDEIKADLVALCNDRSGVVAGRNVTRVDRVGSVSYAKALSKYAPDADLEPYRGKPSVSWRVG